MLIMLLVMAVAWFAWGEWKDVKAAMTKPAPQTQVSPPAPMRVPAKVTGTTSAAVTALPPEQKGTLVTLMDKGGKIVAMADGKEVPLAVQGLAPGASVKLGENGQLMIVTETTVTIDFSKELNARVQAELEKNRLAWERDTEKQLSQEREKTIKEKGKNVGIGIGSFLAGALVGRATR